MLMDIIKTLVSITFLSAVLFLVIDNKRPHFRRIKLVSRIITIICSGITLVLLFVG